MAPDFSGSYKGVAPYALTAKSASVAFACCDCATIAPFENIAGCQCLPYSVLSTPGFENNAIKGTSPCSKSTSCHYAGYFDAKVCCIAFLLVHSCLPVNCQRGAAGGAYVGDAADGFSERLSVSSSQQSSQHSWLGVSGLDFNVHLQDTCL